MDNNDKLNEVLCCPLCGSEEYLLSESDSMLCAECGSFFEDVTQLAPTNCAISVLNVQCLIASAASH
ncbi:hypothetical protein [Vibrio brasiliensis]